MNHKAEAEQAAKNGRYDIAMYHSTMHLAELAELIAEKQTIANLMEFVVAPSPEHIIGWDVTAGQIMDAQRKIRRGLGL